ncbi:hypothetical protein FHR87_003820 [Azomonas macrocytogenes]|uniref:Uncharacterized protein n=1 Tax=Azomonas macrocytogenes TaxID=69962 RepID=A0A839TCQ5_AZOMA|nr:hypothetical protein [Azomonas macrocytogenes]
MYTSLACLCSRLWLLRSCLPPWCQAFVRQKQVNCQELGRRCAVCWLFVRHLSGLWGHVCGPSRINVSSHVAFSRPRKSLLKQLPDAASLSTGHAEAGGPLLGVKARIRSAVLPVLAQQAQAFGSFFVLVVRAALLSASGGAGASSHRNDLGGLRPSLLTHISVAE